MPSATGRRLTVARVAVTPQPGPNTSAGPVTPSSYGLTTGRGGLGGVGCGGIGSGAPHPATRAVEATSPKRAFHFWLPRIAHSFSLHSSREAKQIYARLAA